MLSLPQIRFCATECERQQSGEISVYHMCNALNKLDNSSLFGTIMTQEGIQELGRLVEPKKNANGFRKVPVQIGSKIVSHENIEHQINTLLGNTERMSVNWTPEGWYKEFEEIHPFIDGNGRVGAILYNYLKGDLDNPVAPPDMFGNTDKFVSEGERKFREEARRD